ncbi:MAG: hypothetical protein IJC94_09810 [Oscillospiraceae bacterium]|nr:hypothetical protein [Oscillospiraceae bacterium]
MKIKNLLVLAVAAMMFFLSSCSGMDFGIEALILPPKLTNEQSELYTALETAAGTENLRLRYPKSGYNNSAFSFYDIDNDGHKEAIVFYSIQDETDTRINILKNAGNKWISVYDARGKEEVVVSVEFAEFTEGKTSIVIGWQNTISGNNIFTVYGFAGNTLSEEFSTSYEASAVCDLTGDGCDDAVIFSSTDESRETSIRLVSSQGDELRVISEEKLSIGAAEYLSVKNGSAAGIENALYVDYKIADESYSTDILYFENNKLKSLFALKGEELPIRYEALLSEDIDNDGVIEIPYQTAMEGAQTEEEEITYLTTYYEASKLSIYPKFTAVINIRDGYMYKLSADWVDSVVLIKSSYDNEWSFCELLDNNIVGMELLRIRTVNKNTYHDKFDETYRLIAEKGVNQYYIFVPSTESELQKTFVECKNNFSVIDK